MGQYVSEADLVAGLEAIRDSPQGPMSLYYQHLTYPEIKAAGRDGTP